ncbi:MAG: SpoIIE family protein phosphatase [Moorellales bacterium]
MAEGVEVHPYRRLGAKPQPKRSRARVTELVPGMAVAFWCGVAFLLGRATVFGELHPFAPAFYAALMAARPTHWALGLILAAGLATSLRGLDWLGAVAGLAAIGLALGKLGRNQKGVSAVSTASLAIVGVLVPKGLLLTLRPAVLDQVIALGTEALLAGLLSLAFGVVFSSRLRREVGAPIGEEVACWLLFLLGLLVGLDGLKPLGVPVVKVGAGILVLLAALTGGAGGGTVAGVAVGAVPFLTALEPPAWISLYAVSGLLAGVLASFRRAGTVLGFLSGILVMSVYFFERSAIVETLEASLAAAAVFCLLPDSLVGQVNWLPLAGERAEDYWRRRLRRSQELIRDQLRQLAVVFKDLGESFRQTLKRGERDEAGAGVPSWASLVSKVCSSCPAQELCLQKEGATIQPALLELLPVLRDKQRVELEDLPVLLRGKCIRPRELVAGVNRTWETYCRYLSWQRHLEQTRELVSQQLFQVAGLIGELEKRVALPGETDRRLALTVGQALRREGLPVEDTEVLVQRDGRMEIRLALPRCESRGLCRQRLRDLLARTLEQRLAVDDSRCPWVVGGKSCQVRFLPAGSLKIGTGLAQAARDGCAFCGDAWAAVALPSGYYFLGLSDGMGSGPRAAVESGRAMSLVTRLLSLGFSPEIAVHTVNSLLLQPGETEKFATMDLAFVNLYTGEGRLVKVGAAPSFLKRGEQVWVLEGGTPPAGILPELNLSVVTRWLEPGDLLVLVTDGVLMRGEEWLYQALAEIRITEPQAVADLLLHQAVALAGNRLRDDMSILAARVERVA